jgi:hypothetical protein
MITFGICVRLHELNIGVLQPSPPEITSTEGVYKRGYTRITAEGEIMDTWNGGIPQSHM